MVICAAGQAGGAFLGRGYGFTPPKLLSSLKLGIFELGIVADERQSKRALLLTSLLGLPAEGLLLGNAAAGAGKNAPEQHKGKNNWGKDEFLGTFLPIWGFFSPKVASCSRVHSDITSASGPLLPAGCIPVGNEVVCGQAAHAQAKGLRWELLQSWQTPHFNPGAFQ